MNFEKGDVVIFCNRESKMYPKQNDFASQTLKYGEVYIVEHVYGGATPQVEVRGQEFMFVEDFFELYNKTKHADIVKVGAQERENEEIRDDIDGVTENGISLYNTGDAVYYLYPVEEMEGLSMALKYTDDNKRLYLSPSLNRQVTSGELNHLDFAILRYKVNEKPIGEVMKEIIAEINRPKDAPTPMYSPVFKFPLKQKKA